MLRAAWYYYKDELTQDEIARRLSMSRASVGRLLDRARRVGLVSINLNTERLDAFELSGELRRAFGLAEALVVPDHEKEPFDHHASQCRRDRAKQHRERQGHAALGRNDRDVRAAHDELAMREIDDAHHAEDHREAERREHQIGKAVAELIDERIENR